MFVSGFIFAIGTDMCLAIALGQRDRHIFLDGNGIFLFILRQIDEAEPAQTQHPRNGVVMQFGAHRQGNINFIG